MAYGGSTMVTPFWGEQASVEKKYFFYIEVIEMKDS